VRHALEPAFERLGPDATPEQILDLKVCDPAMGSGAFLVEACRALAARLVDAWLRYPEKKPVIPPDEDAELHAKRLVAQRCLYGVDKNPLATDLAKLSLWLATLARDHEFSFLDHALKSGDSLVGLNAAQIAAAHWDSSKPGLPLFQSLVSERVAEAMKGRAEIQAAPDDTARAIQEQRHRSLEARLKEIRLMGDTVIAAFFAENKPKAREKKRTEVESWLGGSPVAWHKLAAAAATLKQGAHPLTPFHWEIEFPEVFARRNGGFDAIVGNPPFAGKNTISASNRENFLVWLQTIHKGAHGNADLVAHFFRRSFSLLRPQGTFGLIATNTIGQGDTRDTGLAAIIEQRGQIIRATRRVKWPGEAAVVVSIVHITNGGARSAVVLDNQPVERISAYLVAGVLDHSPKRLAANEARAFQGSIVLGMGFTFDDVTSKKGECEPIATMDRIISQNPRNADCVSPYIGGDEVTNSPDHSYHRYCIRLEELTLEQARGQYPELIEIVERYVKPERNKLSGNPDAERRRKFWWRWGRDTPALYRSIKSMDHVLATNCGATPQFGIARISSKMIFANTLAVFAFSGFSHFCAIQCRTHELWSRQFGSTLEDRLRYTITDCFETFPFPLGFETSPGLEATGRAYHDHRAAVMVARNEGMTKTYNRFHDRSETATEIQRLRDLHSAMDRAALEAYGWHDLAARAAPIFLDETNEDDHTYQGRLFWPSDFRDEVLARLLTLNAERHAEEVRLGIAPGIKGKAEEDEDQLEDA
jgi:hypothetical protein